MDKKSPIASQWFRFGIYFLCLLPLLLFREISPDNEMKYIQIVDEALRDGHFWTLWLNGAAYADKPPLYFWIMMLCRRIFGFHCIPVLELFSLLPAFGILLIFNKWCSSRLPLAWQIAAEMALLTTVYFIGGAMVLRMDMLMVLFITLAMWTFWRVYQGDDRPGLRIAFALYVFMAIFSKGPVGILFPLVTIPVYLLCVKRFRCVWKVWGWSTWLILALLCGIWWLFVYLEAGTPYLNNLLFHQTVDRAVNAFHHKRTWYYYLYTIWYAMGPWSLLTIPVAVWGAVKGRLDELSKFFIIISAMFFVLMTLFSSKLQIYLLPMFGFVNYAAYMILADSSSEYRWCDTARKATYWIAGAILLVAAVSVWTVLKLI